MRKALVFLFIFVAVAGFAQVEYKYQNEETKALWAEWNVEINTIKSTVVLFLHSLPFEVFSEDIDFYSESLLFLGDILLIDDVSLFNNLLREGEILSLDIVIRKMYEAVSQLPLTDEEKLHALERISFIEKEYR